MTRRALGSAAVVSGPTVAAKCQQLLVAAKMEAGIAHAQVHDAKLKGTLERLIDLLSQSLQASRSLTADLSPTVLYQAGLLPALRWLAERMQRIHGLHVEIDAEPDVEPSCAALRIPLFEAARELLFNAVKHAGINEARVEIGRPDKAYVRLTVSDRGRGFDLSRLDEERQTDRRLRPDERETTHRTDRRTC